MTLHDGLTACSALMFIIVLLVGLKPLLKAVRSRQGGHGKSGAGLSLVGQMALDRTRRLSVIRYGSREVLVLTGGSQDVLLEWHDDRTGFAAALEAAS
ncbi:flagellar biogenesis protein FliO [Gluconobacter cerinus]|uniref:flagellar biosynthetic protein FliO n=1 Tax=Gluconobacter cerinus TaxID=38307 RepID=UPI002226D01D|nr:flagellar biosynthetic protein FliO [Gluconobacter cerinus]MCW2264911.1 flagellar biogenesis protein FliO [Gluconobacter cerinus]